MNMDRETFEDMCSSENVSDDQAETIFKLLTKEPVSYTMTVADAFEILIEHRPKLRQVIDTEIFSQISDEQIEKIFDLLAREKDDGEMAWHAVTLSNTNPGLAERIDEKHSLGIKESMGSEYFQCCLRTEQ